MITKKAVKWVWEVYLYQKYTDLKISDDGNWVMACTYNSFEIFDKELYKKGEASNLSFKVNDSEYTYFYDLRPLSGGDYVANFDSSV